MLPTVGTDGVAGGGPGTVFFEADDASEDVVDGDTVLANWRRGVLNEDAVEGTAGPWHRAAEAGVGSDTFEGVFDGAVGLRCSMTCNDVLVLAFLRLGCSTSSSSSSSVTIE